MKIKCKVINRERPGQDIELSHNGTIYQIMDGEEVIIPEGVAKSLEDCIKTEWRKSKDSRGLKTLNQFKVKRFDVVRIESVDDTKPAKSKKA